MLKSKRVILCGLAIGCIAMSTEPLEPEYSYADWLVWELEGHRFDGVVSEPYFDIALNNLYLAANVAMWDDGQWEAACGPYEYGPTVNYQIWLLCYAVTHDRVSGVKIQQSTQRIDLEAMTVIIGHLYREVDYIGPDREPEQLRNERDR